MIRSIDDRDKYKQPELVSPTSTVLQEMDPLIYIFVIYKTKQNQLLVMADAKKFETN